MVLLVVATERAATEVTRKTIDSQCVGFDDAGSERMGTVWEETTLAGALRRGRTIDLWMWGLDPRWSRTRFHQTGSAHSCE